MDGGDTALRIALIGVLVLVNAAFAGSELALLSLTESQIRRLRERGGRGRVVARLVDDPNSYLATVQIGITLTGFLASATAALTLAGTLEPVLEPAFGGAANAVAVVGVTLVLTFVTLVFGELAPKRLAMQWAEPWSLIAGGPLALLGSATRPAVWLLGVSTNAIVRVLGGEAEHRRAEMTPEEIRHLVIGQASMSAIQKEIITGAVEAGERPLREVLIPRNAVLMLDREMTCADAIAKLVTATHHRAPVIHGDLDHALGVVSLIELLGQNAQSAIAALTQPALVLPETVRVLEALRRMQAEHREMALVSDEHGGIAGIVTVEDLVEELVGEIFDEFDRDVLAADRRGEDELEVVGRYPVHDLVDLGIELPEGHGEYATVGGLIMSELGRIARVGDAVEVAGWRISVLDARAAVIRRVRLERIRGGEADPPRADDQEDAEAAGQRA
ncbi:MAG: hemolysin family protein [Chloroflexi bacterium]|nr:hemolysin family protein [Chloroflexota bacterium]MDA1001839.1 hemolysin family protein [Chloroflexota bacterium]MQC27452.1 HlyC/CorC family transporter [Chloroflexota bacterium]